MSNLNNSKIPKEQLKKNESIKYKTKLQVKRPIKIDKYNVKRNVLKKSLRRSHKKAI